MSEAKVKASATARLIAEHPRCCFCGERNATETREHMPPKAMFDASHRPDRLVMPACHACNKGTSTADLVVSIISRWRFGEGSDQEKQDHRKLVGQIGIQAPLVLDEWRSSARHQDQARAHLEQFIPLPAEGGFPFIGPETIRQLNLFSHKLVLGLYFERLKRAVPADGLIWAFWKTKEDVLYGGRPDFLLNMLPDYGTLIQGEWETSEVFEFQSRVDEQNDTFGCCARFRGGLLAGGFAMANQIGDEFKNWTHPPNLLTRSATPLFARRDL